MDTTQDILGYVYTITDRGHELLWGEGGELPQIEQELLVRIDGRTTREQLITAMAHFPRVQVQQTLHDLVDAGLITTTSKATPDDRGLDFTAGLDGAQDTGETTRLALAALEHTGYYVNISRRAINRRKPRNGRQYSVLVVEDDPMMMRLLCAVLGEAGFLPQAAGTRAEILAALSPLDSPEPPRGRTGYRDELIGALAHKALPDVVLLDVVMPEVNGFDVLANLRAHPVYRELVIVMLSACTSREDILRGLAEGADGYITKPFKADRVLSAVRNVLGL